MPSEKDKDSDVVMTNKDNKEKEESKDKDKDKEKDPKKKESKDKDKEDLTEEDKELKANLELMVTVITEPPNPLKSAHEDSQLRLNALESLRSAIRSSTSSMTSIPKPLKFLKNLYPSLREKFDSLSPTDSIRSNFADVLSVLSMTLPLESEQKERASLKYKMVGNPNEPIDCWGHEYVRNLAGQIGKEFQQRQEEEKPLPFTDLDSLIDQIIPFFVQHNAEYDAVDLLVEVEAIGKIKKYLVEAHSKAANATTSTSSSSSSITTSPSLSSLPSPSSLSPSHSILRVCAYMTKCVELMADEDEQKEYFNVIFSIYLECGELCDALRVGIRMNDIDMMAKVMDEAAKKDPSLLISKQLAFILGDNRIVLPSYRDNEPIMEVMGNSTLSNYFQQLAAELDVKEAKTPEDIYKSHLEEGAPNRRGVQRAGATATTGVDSAKQNLASSFVNAFVNCAFGKDLLITPEGSDWLYKNKSHGMMSATASLGLLLLWDVESGFSSVDKYTFSKENFIKAGAAMAQGVLSAGITSDMDAAQALLSEHVEAKDLDVRLSAIFGLGLAYCGSAAEDLLERFIPIIVDDQQPMEIVAHACLSLGLVFCGTANEDVSGPIIESFMDRSETDLKDSSARLMCLGLGLVFLNRGSMAEAALVAIRVIQHPISQFLEWTVMSCAWAGIANPEQIQKFLGQLTEHVEEDEKDPMKGIHQEACVLGITLAAMGEDLTTEMALRSLDHVLQYGEVNLRRVVPLALGLLSLSNPRLQVGDTLSKLSHDQDEKVSQNAIVAMGLIGAGTNNSRLATALRQLASYYSKEPNHLFLVRISQGLLHLGKGLMSLSPLRSEGFITNRPAMAGILVLLYAFLDMKNSILNKRHYLLFSVAPAIRPRMLMTLDENLKPIAVQVRLGQKVDLVGQAGKQKGITGFQTHKTPVLMSAGERAELATEEYIALNSILEGFVIVKKNPNYKPGQ